MATHFQLNLNRARGWRFWQKAIRRRPKRLRLVESLPLGERRFVAVINVDGRDFLVGAAPQSVQLLTELINEEEMAGAMLASRNVQ